MLFRTLPQFSAIQQYGFITANYWGFTITDGALRMLVVLYFHQLGYGALEIAFLFLFYEFFGVVTNLVGGWLGARIGLNKTMHLGMCIQIIALCMLLLISLDWSADFFSEKMVCVIWVMLAQALSGIAKDLNKMSAKSAIKQLVPANKNSTLFKWVALLTGSKNALKGFGFFLGALLLQLWGFSVTLICMIGLLCFALAISSVCLKGALGQSQSKPKFTQIFAKSRAINLLSAARLFLFAARDIWFVVALPVFFSQQWQWQPNQVGSFFALWIIGYGIIQSLTPIITRRQLPTAQNGAIWAFALAAIPLALTWYFYQSQTITQTTLIAGLFLFGAVFAINSAMHSYLIVNFASHDGTSMDVGFYYMANAAGRLLGTVLSGLIFQVYGLNACLLASSVCVLLSGVFIAVIPKRASLF